MADGTLMTVGANTVKDSVGYHLAQLMVGSEGTLGIIVEATLKLIPKPATKAVISAFFDNVNCALNSINHLTGRRNNRADFQSAEPRPTDAQPASDNNAEFRPPNNRYKLIYLP